MSNLVWIITGGLMMSAIAMVGAVSILMQPATLKRLLLPMVALAAGTLMGGAFFHMVPQGLKELAPLGATVWLVAGFTTFLLVEQFLHWHHSHYSTAIDYQPMTYLVLIGDALHNFLGGVGIASTFILDPKAGITAWIAGAAHEVPQELGDFGVLVHGGWNRWRALLWNVLSALTFPLGALLAYLFSQRFDVSGLVLFGAGNFLYIAASDLVPEIKAEPHFENAVLHFSCFALGLTFMLFLAYAVHR
ncbi:MAG: ZIP family metal transporter [Syntrophus sp. (in: bacteria)]|nr:ZIP family metal transporter [Syntrophus sp. (in: bacteria)]